MTSNLLLTRRIPSQGLADLDRAGVVYRILEPDPERLVDPGALRAAAAEAGVLLSLLTERISADLLTACPALRGVANMAVGYNNVDLAAATRLGIPVSNTPGVLTDTTADLTWALLLAVARQVVPADAYMRGGRYALWGPELFLGADVSPGGSETRKTLGIIGLGRIGRAVARRAQGFDMNVLAATRSPQPAENVEFCSLDALLARSDFVSIHAPLTPETRHMIGERELRLMKPTAYLINVARGDLVDEAALVRALREHWIACAALDVFEHEPAMAPGLAECENALIVPHIGSASIDTRNSMAATAAANAIAHLHADHAPNVLNPEVYDSAEYRARIRG